MYHFVLCVVLFLPRHRHERSKLTPSLSLYNPFCSGVHPMLAGNPQSFQSVMVRTGVMLIRNGFFGFRFTNC